MTFGSSSSGCDKSTGAITTFLDNTAAVREKPELDATFKNSQTGERISEKEVSAKMRAARTLR